MKNKILHLLAMLALALAANAQNKTWEMLTVGDTKLTSDDRDFPATLYFTPAADGTCDVKGMHLGKNTYALVGKCWKEGETVRMKVAGIDADSNTKTISGVLRRSNYDFGTIKLREATLATAKEGVEPDRKNLRSHFDVTNSVIEQEKQAQATAYAQAADRDKTSQGKDEFHEESMRRMRAMESNLRSGAKSECTCKRSRRL